MRVRTRKKSFKGNDRTCFDTNSDVPYIGVPVKLLRRKGKLLVTFFNIVVLEKRHT